MPALAATLAGMLFLCPGPGRGATKLTPRQLIDNLRSKNFTGERVDISFEQASLPEILSRFEAISGLKFRISPEVLSLSIPRMQYRFMGSRWDNALASILSGQGLDLRLEGDTLWVDKYEPEKDRTISAFLIGTVFAALLLGGGLLGLSRRRKRKRDSERERKIALNPEAVEEILQRLTYLFQIEKIHRNDRLTLDSLSERLSLQPYQLSGIINGRVGKSFSDFVAAYRVEDVKKRLSDPGETANILNIAFDAGFGTKASFNRIFKEQTGQTPSEFKRKTAESDSTGK